MATFNDLSSSTADPLSLECKLCDKTYQHKDGPLMLPCLHSFCKPCLIKYFEKEQSTDNKMGACPTCNDRFPLPKDLNQLPVNLRLSHLAKTTMYEKQAEGGQMKCQKCRGPPKDATTFCCNHCKFVCEQCQDDYIRFCENEDLEFIDLNTYKKGEFKVHAPPCKCHFHKKHELILYCNNCSCLICICCAQTKHQNHDKSSIEENIVQEKAKLQQRTNGVDEALHTMDQTLQQIQEMRDKIKVSAKEATNRINKTCDDLIQAVENRREVLKRRCQEIAEGKDDVLSNQMVEVDKLRRKLEYAKLHARDAIDKSTPEELLSIKGTIEDKLSQGMEMYDQCSLSLQEDDRIGMVVATGDIMEGIGSMGSFAIPDHQKSQVACPKAAFIGKECKAIITLKDGSGAPVKHKSNFQFKLRKAGTVDSGSNECCIPSKAITITPGNDDGMVTLVFTPDKLGEYELIIMVRNKPIGASPYQITASPYQITASEIKYSMFPTMAASASKLVGGQCFGVTVDSKANIYGLNYKSQVIKVYQPSSTESQIGSSSLLSQPFGIALLDDTLYIASRGNNRVVMYSTNGTHIRTIGSHAGSSNNQFNSPWGICTDAGSKKVFVADTSNNRVQVFTSQGDFIKSIPCSAEPYDVAVDPLSGNIHATLRDIHSIEVFSLEGNKLDTYSLNGTLKSPCGIHIDCYGYRFISSYDVNEVAILDPTGTLVAKRGGFNNPWGITTDINNTLYVTEGGGKRILVYSFP